MNSVRENNLNNLLFLVSPLILLSVLIFATLLGHDSLIGVLSAIAEYYSIFFLIISSYIYQRGRNKVGKAKSDAIILIGYAIGSSTFFSWMFLLPFMEEKVGMWDSQFLNMTVTLAFSYFIFFCLVGVQKLFSNAYSKAESSHPV